MTMVPIHDLLSRIRWDPGFAKGRFTIGYADRLKGTVYVPLQRIQLGRGNDFFMHFVDDEGAVCHVPLHRIREVLRDGVPIWRRPVGPMGDARV
jgi:uncharacterized protein (UPF0248 family)